MNRLAHEMVCRSSRHPGNPVNWVELYPPR